MIVSRMKLWVMNFVMLVTMMSLAILQSAWFAKMLIALKHLGYGHATNLWIDYFHMGESTGCLCVEILCKCIAEN